MELQIKGLTKKYRKVTALDKIDMLIRPGIHGLLGPNGAGKTTLMRILATVLPFDEGSIKWGELTWEKGRVVKEKIGYLPQQFGMYKYLTVNETLSNIAVLKNIPANQERRQVDLALEKTNLSELRKRKVGQLSGGMLRRLGIAQAILGDPELMILDEPSAGLDPEERINLRNIIRDYNNGKRVIIVSSHIVTDLDSLCSHLSVMDHGKVVLSDSTDNIRRLANGWVKEKKMSEEEFLALEKSKKILNYVMKDGCYRVRFLSDAFEEETASEATLEDSYALLIQRNNQ